MAKKRVLTEYQLERLKEHKYSSTGNTLLDPLMQIFWRWLVEQIPTSWAPNSITLTGLIGNIVTTIFLMLYCPRGYGYAPTWCYILCAMGLFMYQSLDAIDGKQARRTSSSTPLGELFDHGCDAMSMALIVVGASISTELGKEYVIMAGICMIATSLFYLAQWRTYVTYQMHFGIFDVTEGQMCVIALYIHNAIFGNSIWQATILGVELKMLFWIGATFFACLFIFNFLHAVFLSSEARERNRQQAHLDDAKKSWVPHHLKPSFLLILLWSFFALCMLCSKEGLVQNHTVLYIILFSTISTKMSCLMLVAHMTKTEVAALDPVFLAPFTLLTWQLFPPASELTCLALVTVFSLANLLYYVVRVCSDICDHLDIYCFKITPVMQEISH